MATKLARRLQGDTPFFKVCCIQDAAEAACAVRAGAAALGLVSAMPSGPGVIAEAAIAAIVPTVPRDVATVLLTSATEAAAVVSQVRRTGVSAVQLCDALAPAAHRALRHALPDTTVIQVVHVLDTASVAEALDVAARPEVDALLLDSGDPRLAVKSLGGTGRVHNWALSAEICRRARVPVLLAGGIRADNAGDALATVRPFGVDVCTGVRVAGRLDEATLAALVRALRAAADASPREASS